MGGTGPTCILLQGFHIMSVTDKTQKTENPETTFAKPLDVVKDSDLSCQQKAKTLDTWEQDARELYRKDAQMTKKTLDWTPDLELPAGTGATFQKFKAQSGDDQLVIKATEGGEGNLKVNATQVASIAGDRDSTEVVRDLEKIAEDYECAHQQVPQGLKSK